MRVATCPLKGNRLALCESESCHDSCSKAGLWKILEFDEYLQLIQEAVGTKRSIDQIINKKENKHGDCNYEKGLQTIESTSCSCPRCGYKGEKGGVEEVWEGSEV